MWDRKRNLLKKLNDGLKGGNKEKEGCTLEFPK